MFCSYFHRMRCLWCLLLLAFNSSYAQSSHLLQGTWEGMHHIAHIKDSAFISITIDNVSGQTFSGTSYGHFFENPGQNYYRSNIKGHINGNKVIIDILPHSEAKLASYPAFYWCTGRSVLLLQKNNNNYVLAGQPDPDGCLTGPMQLKKKEETQADEADKRAEHIPGAAEKYMTRRNILTQTIPLQNRIFRIALSDNGTIDGDTVSVYFSGKLVADRLALTAIPFIIHLEATDTTDNELIMYAENEGCVPPNTALMIIYADNRTYPVNLKAGYRNNALIRFVLPSHPK